MCFLEKKIKLHGNLLDMTWLTLQIHKQPELQIKILFH